MSPEQLACTRVKSYLSNLSRFYEDELQKAQKDFQAAATSADSIKEQMCSAAATAMGAEQLASTAAGRPASAAQDVAAEAAAAYQDALRKEAVMYNALAEAQKCVLDTKAAIAAFSSGMLGSWAERADNAAQTDVFAVGVVLAELLGLQDDSTWFALGRVDEDPSKELKSSVAWIGNLDQFGSMCAIQQYIHQVKIA